MLGLTRHALPLTKLPTGKAPICAYDEWECTYPSCACEREPCTMISGADLAVRALLSGVLFGIPVAASCWAIFHAIFG